MHCKAVLMLVGWVTVITAAETPGDWNNRGAERFQAGDIAGAEKLYLRALDGWDQAREPRLAARTMSNLAVVYRAEKRYGDAEEMYRKALLLLENSNNGESAETITTLNNMAELYRIQGRARQGEPYARRAVVVAERVFGAKSLATADALHTLAANARERGSLDEALEIYGRAGALLTNDGTRLARNLANVAEIRLAKQEYAQAESAAQCSVAIAESVNGLNNLAQALRFQHRFDEAEALYRKALTLAERDRAASGKITANLAGSYHDQERESHAAELYARALKLLEASLGPDDPETALVRTRFAEVRRAQGRYAQSLDLYRDAMPLLERSYGAGDPRVTAALHDFASTQREAERYLVQAH